jgi:hypothetical protein
MDKSSPEYTARYRATINKLIDDITTEIPADIQHISLVAAFESVKQSNHFSAPEVLDNSICGLLTILRLHVPWHDDESKNPQWVINIRKIWTAAVTFIDDGLVEKVDGPPETAGAS